VLLRVGDIRVFCIGNSQVPERFERPFGKVFGGVGDAVVLILVHVVAHVGGSEVVVVHVVEEHMVVVLVDGAHVLVVLVD
jgi:hypothetical protein